MDESAAIAAEDPPALVNFAVTRCRLDSAAYVATILDLAARGYLVLTEPEPTHLRCGRPATPPPDSGLFPAERMVLRDVRSRLAVLDDAPFEALAEACSADVRGCWDPFEKAVRAEARARGLTRPRLSAGTRRVLQAAAVAVGVVGYLAVHAHSRGTWVALSTGFLAWILPASWIGAVGRWERLSTSGGDLARWAQARSDSLAVGVVGGVVPPPVLKHLAYAVAGGAPVPIAGLTHGRPAHAAPGGRRAGYRAGVSGEHESTGQPRAAWSSLNGLWRLVTVGRTGVPVRRRAAVLLALSAWAALLAYPASLLPDPAGVLVPGTLLAGAAAGAVGGFRALAYRMAQPRVTEFDGQVIARWVAHGGSGDDDSYTPCIAIDDGRRAWSFAVGPGFSGRLGLGDLVHVRVAARSMKLLDITPAGQPVDAGPAAGDRAGHAVADPAGWTGPDLPGPAAADPADWTGGDLAGPAAAVLADLASRPPLSAARLLTDTEVTEALGRPVRSIGLTTPVGGAVIYRGSGVTVSVTVAVGALRGLSSGPARRFGDPLPGIGDEAWLVNRNRTLVVRVGALTAKITIGAQGLVDTYSVLAGLAPTLAARLAEYDS